MKKNLFIAALAFVAMGANAQVVNTLDGYQAGDQFTEAGVVYEVVEVSDQSAATVKVVEAAETEVTVQAQFIKDATYTVTDFSAGLANKDLEKVTAVAAEPIAIADGFFSDATFEEGVLIVPEAAVAAYAKAAVWKKFYLKYTDTNKLLGDANGDGKISNQDVVNLKDLILEDDDELYNPLLDMNGDGKFSNQDLILLKDVVLADLF
jgi:preprotein translocase subunit YajC